MAAKPTTTRTLNPLPFLDLDPHRFEDLVRNLIYQYRSWKSIEATGRAGSDEGFDVRAWEDTGLQDNNVEEPTEDEVTSRPDDGRVWKVQCKREKALGPTRVREIVKEGVSAKEPPYGYILVAPTNFSKKSYDAFREELRTRGVQEFFLWGRAELEDMLYLPKNDSILFAFFGISLVSQKRKRSTDLKFALNNKNKLLRVLAGGSTRQHIQSAVLFRDVKDEQYPYSGHYEDFEKSPRWKEFTVTELHPRGAIAHVRKHFAFIDEAKKEFDLLRNVDLLIRRSDDFDEQKAKQRQDAQKAWRYLKHVNKGEALIYGMVTYEDMLLIDEKGDAYFDFPHVFVDFIPNKGPFRYFWVEGSLGAKKLDLDDGFRKVDVFSKIKPPTSRTIYDRRVQLDERSKEALQHSYSMKCLVDVDDRYSFLKSGDVIGVENLTSRFDSRPVFIEITNKYEVPANEYLSQLDQAYKPQVEWQIGRRIKQGDKLLVLEFETTSAPR